MSSSGSPKREPSLEIKPSDDMKQTGGSGLANADASLASSVLHPDSNQSTESKGGEGHSAASWIKEGVPLLSFKHLSRKQALAIVTAPSMSARASLIRQLVLQDRNLPEDDIVYELFTYAMAFAVRQSFNAEQVSVVYALTRMCFLAVCEDPHITLETLFQRLEGTLLMHTVHWPPKCDGVFTLFQAQEILAYFLDSFLAHLKLYKYAFCPDQTLELNLDVKQTDMREHLNVVINNKRRESKRLFADQDKEPSLEELLETDVAMKIREFVDEVLRERLEAHQAKAPKAAKKEEATNSQQDGGGSTETASVADTISAK